MGKRTPPPSQLGTSRHSCHQGCWLHGLLPFVSLGEGLGQCWCLETCLAWHFFKEPASQLSGHFISQPGLGMDQVLILVTAQEVPKPRAEEVLPTAEAAWLAWVQHCCLILETVSVLHSQVLPYWPLGLGTVIPIADGDLAALPLLHAFNCPCVSVGRSHPSLSLLRLPFPSLSDCMEPCSQHSPLFSVE